MSSPLFDASSATSPTQSLQGLTPRQQIERVLDTALPAPGSALEQAASSRTELGRDQLVEPVERINEVMRNYGVQFDLGEEYDRVVTRIIDQESGDVIRQIPAEEVMRIAARLNEVQGRLIELEA